MTIDAKPVVSSNNDWDPLEEVVVGVLEGAAYMPWDLALEACTHADYLDDVSAHHLALEGKPRAPEQIAVVQRQLDGFLEILESAGVTVRRPEPLDQARPFGSMDWTSAGGNAQANPRDAFLVVGDEIIEVPMAVRARYFEAMGYRALFHEYFRRGARWTAAPRPRLGDDLYDPYWQRSNDTYVTTEVEPVFDAADVTRLGRDLVMQRSQVSNRFGAEWLQRHLGDTYRVHVVEFEDDDPLHIDTTFVPLCPGKVLVNPDRPIKALPTIFEGSDWEFLEAPRTTLPTSHPAFHAYAWYHLNVLMLDEKRVVVEAEEGPLLDALVGWGFDPVPCSFRAAAMYYAGGFHCFTLDIRRRGALQSYF